MLSLGEREGAPATTVTKRDVRCSTVNLVPHSASHCARSAQSALDRFFVPLLRTPFHYADIDEYLRAARGTGERRRLDSLQADQVERVRSALAARMARYQDSGSLHIPTAALLATAAR